MAASPSASRKTVEVVMTPLGTEMTRTTTPSKKVPGRSFFGFVPDAGDCKSLSFASPKSSPSIASRDRSPQQQRQQMRRDDDDDDDEVMSVIVRCPDADDDNGPIRAQSAAQLTAIPIANDGNDHNRLAIVGGKVVNDDIIFEADIYIEDGVIKKVGRDVALPEGCRTIDAKGKLVLPGGVDPHTHFEMEFMGARAVDDFYHGSRAALAGGTTMIIDFAVGVRGESIVDVYQRSRDAGDGKSCCDYGLHVCVLSWDEKVKSDMQLLTTQKGVNSFKMFMTYNAWRILDDEMLCVMEWCKELGALAQIHAENCDALNYNADRLVHLGITGPEGHEQSRPEEVEAEATNRAIVLANQVNCPVYIVHINSKKAADVFVQRRLEGYVAFGEVLAAGLGTDGTHQYNKCWRHAAGHVMSPPLRPDVSTPAHLMNLVSSGAVQVTASDNCTFSAEQKAMGKDDFRFIPNGVNGVEDRMSVVWEKGVMTGKLDPCQFVAATSSNAAKIFNVYPRKGRIAVGSDADLVVWDPRATRTISSKTHKHNVDFNIFEGMECHGVPSYVVSNGRVVVERGELTVSAGAGRFVPTPVFSPTVYMRVHERETARAPFKVEREAYEGPVADAESGAANGTPTKSKGRRENVETPVTSQAAPQFQYSRPLTSSGGRNMQDSSFSLSGAQIDDSDVQGSKTGRAGIRVHNPPGGKSTGLW